MLRAFTAGTLLLATIALAPGTTANICGSASGCEFWDGNYHQYILYSVDTPTIDVLILPPVSPYAAQETKDIEKSVDAWKAGIASLGASWFSAGIHINRYTMGTGVPPTSVLQDPEIVIATAEYNPVLLFGIGEQLPLSVCADHGGAASRSAPHVHEGSSVTMVQCNSGGKVCVVINTNFLAGGDRRMYDLNSHEFGHCLGIGHVGDALDFDAKTVPLADIMSYQYDPNQVHCVSNLDIKSLQGVYNNLLGQPASGQRAPGDYVAMAPADYSQVTCANP